MMNASNRSCSAPRRRDLLDVVAQLGEQLRGVEDGPARTRGRAAPRSAARERVADPQPAGVALRPPTRMALKEAAPRSRRRPRSRSARRASGPCLGHRSGQRRRPGRGSRRPGPDRARSARGSASGPTSPQHDAGIRIEPPPSPPCASGTMPPPRPRAAPPLEPPGVRSVSHGLRTGPKRRGSDTGRIPNSGMLVLPTITKPASRMRRIDEGVVARDEVAEDVRGHRVRHPRHRRGVLDRDRDAGERARIVGVDRPPRPRWPPRRRRG